MQKDDVVYVGHMLDTAREAISEVRSRVEYDADDGLRLALTHLLQTLGEAACGVSLPFHLIPLIDPIRER